MTKEQLQNAISKSEFLKGLGYFKTLQDTANENKFAAKTDTINTVKVNGTALTATNNAVDITIAVEKKATANTGYAASYTIKANGTAVSDDINIPKDFVVKNAELKTSTAENYQSIGTSAAGKKYIDLIINTVDASETASHIYLPVEDLVDVYTAGNGLTVANNEFSLVIDNSSANGLSVGANGLALALATATTYSYQAATGTYVSGTTYYTTNTGTATVDTSEFVEGTTDVSSYFVRIATAGTAGAMSVADKTFIEDLKDTTFVEITQADVQTLFA